MKLSAPIYRLKHKARQLARAQTLPLHDALDRIAREEGYASWSLLAARHAEIAPAAKLFHTLREGDLLLVGARPRQGKTLMALALAAEAMKSGRRGAFFTLEYTPQDVAERFSAIGVDQNAFGDLFSLDCSNMIHAGSIIETLATAPRGTLAVVDYLQLLDQRRESPPLVEQVKALRTFARERGLIIVFVSQIDRSYDPSSKAVPDLQDVRLPNPLDLDLFDKTCFLANGEIRFAARA